MWVLRRELREFKGQGIDGEKVERERASWNLNGQTGLSGLEAKREELDGECNWRCEAGRWYQGQWWVSGVWRAESEGKKTGGTEKRWGGPRDTTQGRRRGSRDGGESSKGEGGHGDSENESRWRKSGRKAGRIGNENDAEQMLDRCEEEAVE